MRENLPPHFTDDQLQQRLKEVGLHRSSEGYFHFLYHVYFSICPRCVNEISNISLCLSVLCLQELHCFLLKFFSLLV